jgi:hypothetical protein
MRVLSVFVSLLVLSPLVWGDGLPVQYGLLPWGDLTTSDQGGPYNVPDAQASQVSSCTCAAATSGLCHTAEGPTMLLLLLLPPRCDPFLLMEG